MMDMEAQVAILNHKMIDLEEENDSLKKQLRQYRLKEEQSLHYKMDYFNTLAKVQDLEKTIAELEAKLAAATGGKDGE